MLSNNYDTSSTGLNIEVNISYDIDLSQIYFDENFVNLRGDTYLFISGGIDEEISNNDLIKISEDKSNYKAIIQAYKKEVFYNNLHNKDDNIEDFISDCISELFSNFEDIKELLNILETYNVKHETLFTYTHITGYSQGDYAEIFMLNTLLKEFTSIEDISELNSYFCNLFYDAPINGTIIINNLEFNAYEITTEVYKYNKDDFLIYKYNDDIELNEKIVIALDDLLYKTLDYI